LDQFVHHHITILTHRQKIVNGARVSILCGMWNAEFRPHIICGISDAEKLAEFSIVCSETKVVVCSLLNKRVATSTIVPYCQQIAEHSASVIPQSIRGQILHSVFRIPQSLFGQREY